VKNSPSTLKSTTSARNHLSEDADHIT